MLQRTAKPSSVEKIAGKPSNFKRSTKLNKLAMSYTAVSTATRTASLARRPDRPLIGYGTKPRPGRVRAATLGAVPTYRLHDTFGDDLGLIEHLAPNVEPGDVVVLPDGREALVTARVGAEPVPLAALLEVVIAPSRLEADDALP